MKWELLRSTYDEIADKYETRFLDELNEKPRDRELLAAFAEAVSDSVVEVGCGPGQIGMFVRKRGRHVFGVDLSPRMASLANARLDGAMAADMRSLPLASERLGGLVAFYSLIHMRRHELGTVLREFHRVLRPGGGVLFSAHEGQGELERDQFLEEPRADRRDPLRARRARRREQSRRAHRHGGRATSPVCVGIDRSALRRGDPAGGAGMSSQAQTAGPDGVERSRCDRGPEVVAASARRVRLPPCSARAQW
jgi:SAM-dependent methyltransferase